jgi:hypothetical protein
MDELTSVLNQMSVDRDEKEGAAPQAAPKKSKGNVMSTSMMAHRRGEFNFFLPNAPWPLDVETLVAQLPEGVRSWISSPARKILCLWRRTRAG